MNHLITLGVPSRRFPIQPSAVATLSTICFCLVNAVWACTDVAHRPDPVPSVHADRPIRHVETLTVNTLNSERYVADDKCEAQGIEEINSLLKLSRFEEMWVFLPRAQPSGRCEWHEIGRNEQSTSHQAFVSADRPCLDRLMAENGEIHLYHFHPLVYFECAANSVCKKRSTQTGRTTTAKQTLISDLRFAMPSPNDVYFMMDVTWQFYQYHSSAARIIHRIITPYGMVDYALTEKGRIKYASDKDSRTQGLYIKWVAASALADENIESIISDYYRNIDAALQRLVQSLNTDYLRVTLTTFSANHNQTEWGQTLHLAKHIR